jgi:hypothetical protein
MDKRFELASLDNHLDADVKFGIDGLSNTWLGRFSMGSLYDLTRTVAAAWQLYPSQSRITDDLGNSFAYLYSGERHRRNLFDSNYFDDERLRPLSVTPSLTWRHSGT